MWWRVEGGMSMYVVRIKDVSIRSGLRNILLCLVFYGGYLLRQLERVWERMTGSRTHERMNAYNARTMDEHITYTIDYTITCAVKMLKQTHHFDCENMSIQATSAR